MKIIFLGTNGWYDTRTGNTVSVLVDTVDACVIFDAGFGFYKAKDYIDPGKPVLLFISHLHLDHIIGLHTLPIFKLPQGIDIYAPKNIIGPLRAFLRRPFTTPPLLLPTRLRFHEIRGKERFPFQFELAPLRHSVPCYGYRFTAEGAAIAYCTDTGVCADLKRLASGADLLLAECAMSPDEKGPGFFHMRPQDAARVAKEAGAKRLALFHFDPGKYPTFQKRREAEDAAKKIFADTISAKDGTVIYL